MTPLWASAGGRTAVELAHNGLDGARPLGRQSQALDLCH